MAPATNTRSQSSETRPLTARKATLLCPECEHRSPPSGDWRRRRVGDREISRCPDCNAVVERRPTFDEHDRRTGAVTAFSSVARAAFDGSLAAVRHGVTTPARAVAAAIGRR
ncbi:hypothetical protein SAMN06269185_0075 [Natronoarchaeum philippinense]|uniref:DUF8106 domain-containing protein n=1 Tax=Natronoarchaeum philippinense TaxID=558529 RepID=A0A285MZM2_NATPI|nr:hypothetical protein [Natronoarchaeum philippinense]SNZ02649.1 hypothetical protein SAMN06269185_0075 [Natronoarchaeum philippinense]